MKQLRLEVNEWCTPATAYPLRKVSSAQLTRKPQARGVYRMEGIDGYMLYEVTRAVPVTALKIDNKVWMVDDPLHWYAMQLYIREAALRIMRTSNARGHLRCAGLGLGLMVHAAVQHDCFTKIEVIERSKDVIELVAPLLPADSRVSVVHADFETFTSADTPDVVLWDLAVGERAETFPVLVRGIMQTSSMYPDSACMYFGYRKNDGSVFVTLQDLTR